jgi:hypothetical protein
VFKDLIGDFSEMRLFTLVKIPGGRKKNGLLAVKGKETAELFIEGG